MLSAVWHDTRISLESNQKWVGGEWYEVNEMDQNNIFTPTLVIAGSKTIVRTRKYGAIGNFFSEILFSCKCFQKLNYRKRAIIIRG